ncbi:MAG TPA: signal peptidase II [Micropepsaceae bacterium]|nr:signal peptidase II [Micropepsaceae bacterium]
MANAPSAPPSAQLTPHGASFARLGGIWALATLILDQLVKAVFLYGYDFISCAPCAPWLEGENLCLPCPPVEVTGFLNFVMVWNTGVSFGLFAAGSLAGTLVLVGFSVGMSVLLGVWLMRAENANLALGLGLVIGGALGNAIDRAIYGAVADFFQFHAFGYDWYVFNVADAGIFFGVVFILLDSLGLGPWRTRKE